MTITYHSEGCFRIQSGNFSLVIDPASERFKADITLRTRAAIPESSTPNKDPHDIDTAGEYEIQGVAIKGFQVPEAKPTKELRTAYVAQFEEMRLGFLGHLSAMPDPEMFERLGDIDILFIPLDTPYLSPEVAAKIVKQIEPRIVIPSFSKNPKGLMKELGQTTEPVEKLTLKKKELGTGLKIVWIKE